MKKNIIINGKDRTDLCGPAGYEVTYLEESGPNGGTMQSGLQEKDVICVRARVVYPLMPTREEDAGELLADLYSSKYADVTFFDLKSQSYRTSSCIYDEVNSKHLLSSVDGHDYWYCGTLIFTDRRGERRD